MTNQLLAANESSIDLLDVRTPPRFKIQQKNKAKPQEDIENSHAGIAIPVDVETLDLEATTKKLSFYKYERPTTNSGLSTWILLSGQASTAKPTTKKPVVKPIIEEKNKEKLKENITIVVDTKPNRIAKPIFKKKPSSSTSSPTTTTTTPVSQTTKTVPSTTPTSEKKESSKLTKIKASELNNAVSKKNVSTTISNPTKKTTKSPTTTTTKPTTISVSTTEITTVNTTMVELKNRTVPNSSSLPAEAKDQEVELEPSAEAKKKPASTNKRKKNKNRRKKPGKNDLVKPIKNKNNNAISSQIYSYLAKEIMPTVGAGLVGLMVTAGLATYFLYPFGAARRSDTDIDRRDKDGSYYYTDDYSGGLPEEEVIGKVIAGMPMNTVGSNNYKSPTSRNNYPINNNKYRFVDRRANVQPQKYEGLVKGSVESVPLGPDDYQSYKNDIDKKFVVGNIPKDVDEVTPVTVPEHGPRNLKLQKISSSDPDLSPAYGPRNLRRRKRNTAPIISGEDFTEDPGQMEKLRRERSGISNELDPEELPADVSEVAPNQEINTTVTALNTTSEESVTEVQQESTTNAVAPVNMFFDNIKYVLFLKARLALEVLRNASNMFASYITNVQSNVETKYRNFIRKYDAVS